MTGIHKKLLGIAALGLAFAAPAQADIITFEGYAGPVTNAQGWSEAGYNVGFFANDSSATEDTLVGQFFDGDVSSCDSSLVCPPNRYGTYYAALDDTYLYITPDDGAVRVQVKSFDASFIGTTNTPLSSYPGTPALVRIQGFLNNGRSVSEVYALTGANSTGFDFGHFQTSASFSNNLFTAVAIFALACDGDNCTAFSTDRGQFGIDNIQLTDVPEPASLAIVGLGLFGLSAARRRKS